MLTLYLVTDRELAGERPIDDVVNEAVAGGVTCVQVREKHTTTRAFVDQAQRIRRVLDGTGVPLLINDRVDVALAVGADGVHLGQGDLHYPAARSLLGPNAIIGLSVETPADVDEAEEWDVDYLAVSPVFTTPTKRDTRGSWGLDGVERVREMSRHPLVAIGGINLRNAADVMRSGADGIAVVSAICSAPDPRRAAAELRRRVDRVLQDRATTTRGSAAPETARETATPETARESATPETARETATPETATHRATPQHATPQHATPHHGTPHLTERR